MTDGKSGELTETQGGGTDGNEPESMETVGVLTKNSSWPEEVVRFECGVLEQFVRTNDMAQRSEYSVRDIMHVFRNVIDQRDLREKTNTLCVMFDAELRSILGMRSSYQEEFKERVKEMTTPTGRMVTRGPRILFNGKIEMRPVSLGEMLYKEQGMARQMKCRVGTAMLNLLATVPKAGFMEKTEWKRRVMSGILTYGEVCDGISAHILNNRSTLLEENNPRMCVVDGDPLQELFHVRCFHRTQITALIKKHLEPIGMSRPAMDSDSGTTGAVIETIIKQEVEQVSDENARSVDPVDDTWLIVDVGMKQLGINDTPKVARKWEEDEDETVERRQKSLRKEPIWKNYNPHPRTSYLDDIGPFDDEVYHYGGDIRALNQLLIDHLKRVVDIVWQTGEDVTFWTDCPQERILNKEEVRICWTTRRYFSEVPEQVAYLRMDRAANGKELFYLNKYIQLRNFELQHNGCELMDRLALYGFEVALRNWDNWRESCLVMVVKNVKCTEIMENLRKYLRISKTAWIKAREEVDTP